ncbi:MAG: DUF72 domain-containing protein [Desulfobacterales bacterium]
MLYPAVQRSEERKCRIRVGTSGYSYPEWVASGFYPAGIRQGEMLPAYARVFPATELNYTWYQMPKAASVERMLLQVPPGFRFAAKLNRTLTHEVDSDQWRSRAACYRDGIAPLTVAGRLAAVLVQLPPHFDRSLANRRYLAGLLEALEGLPVAVEFRHGSWAADRVFAELEKRKVALVAVDEPELPGLFPRLDVVTHPGFFYVRFHGRNTRGWRSGNLQQQFDYDYPDDELHEWVENRIGPMSRRAGRGLIFFNNHVRGQAPANARRLATILTEQGLLEPPQWIDPSSI